MIRPDIDVPHEQEWELWHNSFSLCSKKVRVCLAELGISYASREIQLVETGWYENISPRFLAINPAGTVPVLVHRGHPVYESHDQIVYASDQVGDAGVELLPRDPEVRQLVEHWMDRASLVGDPLEGRSQRAGHCVPGLTVPLFATTIAGTPVFEILKGFRRHPDRKRPALFLLLKALGLRRLPRVAPVIDLIRESRAGMAKHLDAVSAQLEASGGPWIAGPRFTLADVSWMVLLDRLVEADWQRCFWGEGQRPRVADWWERLQGRPSFRVAVEDVRTAGIREGIAALAAEKSSNAALREALEG